MTSLRILVVGGRPASGVARRLEESGHRCVASEAAKALESAAKLEPQAVVLTGPWGSAPKLLARLRSDARLKHLPIVADGSASRPGAGLEFDAVARSVAELEQTVTAALRARQAVAKEDVARARLEALLEITRLACDSRDAEMLLSTVADKLKAALRCEQVSALSLEGARARLIDPSTGAKTPVDLALTPAMRQAVATRSQAVTDKTLVQPLSDAEQVCGAFLLRRAEPWSLEEQQFVAAVAGAVARSVDNTRLYQSLQRERSELEAAYVDRYHALEEANRRLKAVDKLKDELLAVVSHDVRAPLQVLIGHGRLLLDSKDLKDQHRPSVETTVRMGKKILGLVESLLDKARTDAQPLALEKHLFDLAEVVSQTVEELQILAREQKVLLQAEAPMSVDVLGDELKVRQVLQNLITNALAHATGATKVKVRCTPVRTPDGTHARVVVEDDGAGVSEEQLPKLFDRYTRSGLGLTICKDFIGLHGGEIWAQRGTPKGTTFVFTLPLQAGALPAAEATPVPAVGAPRVLVALNDPQLLQQCDLALRGSYRLEHARDGDEALEKARRQPPDLVIVDLFLPRRDGLETIKALGERPETAKIPLLLLSSRSDLGRQLPPTVEVLPRPFEPQALLTRARSSLARRGGTQTSVGPGNDPHTGLFDQLGLVTRLEEELSRAGRYDRPLTIAVLKPLVPPRERTAELATVVRNELRTPDLLGHLGNGVLVVLLPETALEPARGLTARLCQLLEAQGVGYSARLDELRGQQTAAAALESLLA